MSVSSCKEIRESPTGASYDDKGVRTYEREFVVVCTTSSDGPITVLAASGLPVRGDSYSFANDGADATAKCVRLRPRRHPNSDVHWRVTAEYSTKAADPESQDNNSDNPLDFRPKARFGSARMRKVLGKAYTEGTDDRDVEVVNTAGDPFVPALEFDEGHRVIVITRNELENPDPTGLYEMSVNASEFAGLPVGSVLLYGIGAELEYFKGTRYFSVSYELHFSAQLHKIVVASSGIRELKDGVASKIVDKKTNTPITKPVGLTEAGSVAGSAEEIKYLDFWPYPFRDWSFLNIPNPFTIGL